MYVCIYVGGGTAELPLELEKEEKGEQLGGGEEIDLT